MQSSVRELFPWFFKNQLKKISWNMFQVLWGIYISLNNKKRHGIYARILAYLPAWK